MTNSKASRSMTYLADKKGVVQSECVKSQSVTRHEEPGSFRTHLNLDALKEGWREFKERTTER